MSKPQSSSNVIHFQVPEDTIIDLRILIMEIDGLKMTEKTRELKIRKKPYKEYKLLNSGKCSFLSSIPVCSKTK